MRLRTLAQEPLHKLAGEAAWRGVRSIRQWKLRRAGEISDKPVHFRPIGYHQAHRVLASAHSSQNILAYAEAILRGNYPLMGYGNPHLGITPDWHTDWVSGLSWPMQASEKIVVVRHDGSDVKAPWELSRLQFDPLVAQVK